MDLASFRKQVQAARQAICQEMLAAGQGRVRVKKQATALANLDRIFRATLKIGNRKGFQAMTMRDLVRETGLSMGALYAYFAGKDALLEMMQTLHRRLVQRVLDDCRQSADDPWQGLQQLLTTHLYLSEVLQPWFFFSYMESKNLSAKHRELAVAGSRITEEMIAEALEAGQAAGVLAPRDPRLAANLIKALLQNWYLKRTAHLERGIGVDRYAEELLAVVAGYLQPAGASTTAPQPTRRS
jgi:AcrR family transcriptional regulator